MIDKATTVNIGDVFPFDFLIVGVIIICLLCFFIFINLKYSSIKKETLENWILPIVIILFSVGITFIFLSQFINPDLLVILFFIINIIIVVNIYYIDKFKLE